MSFLGSIGCLMQGIDLHAALKNVYATVTPEPFVFGKGLCSRNTWSYALCLSRLFTSLNQLSSFRDVN